MECVPLVRIRCLRTTRPAAVDEPDHGRLVAASLAGPHCRPGGDGHGNDQDHGGHQAAAAVDVGRPAQQERDGGDGRQRNRQVQNEPGPAARSDGATGSPACVPEPGVRPRRAPETAGAVRWPRTAGLPRRAAGSELGAATVRGPAGAGQPRRTGRLRGRAGFATRAGRPVSPCSASGVQGGILPPQEQRREGTPLCAGPDNCSFRPGCSRESSGARCAARQSGRVQVAIGAGGARTSVRSTATAAVPSPWPAQALRVPVPRRANRRTPMMTR
jgi:hypothetical protein